MATPFDKDLGYLDRFLDKLRAHAATLSEEDAARLGALLDEEAERWPRIRALLGAHEEEAAAPRPEPSQEGAAEPEPTGHGEGEAGTPAEPGSAPPTPEPATPGRPRFTVGRDDARAAPRPGWTVGDPRRG